MSTGKPATSFPRKTALAAIFIPLIYFSLLKTSEATDSIPNFDLSSTVLDPTKTGFTISSNAAAGGYLGAFVKTAGDIDKDGYDDIIIGAYSNSGSKGVTYVVYGGPSLSLLNINIASFTTLDPAITGFTIMGESSGDTLGVSVSTAGDINQDGYADIIIGAPNNNVNTGEVYVIYGAERSSFSHIDLSSTPLDPSTTGFTIAGGASADLFGASVSTAGDLNKDGYNDIIIGAYGYNGGQGAVYLIYGGPKSSLPNIYLSSSTLNPATTGFTIKGEASSNYLGSWVSRAGDVNKDGYDDIIFGAFGNLGNTGAVYVVYGGPKSPSFNIDLSSTALVPGTTGFKIKGNAPNDLLGVSVDTAGDINNDGYDDIIMGACAKNSNQGVVYVIYGGEKSSLQNIDLGSTSLNPATTGFTLIGDVAGDSFGFPVSTAGDVNNDGFDDIIIGANGKNSLVGAAYVIYGGPKSSLLDRNFASTPLDPATTGFMVFGQNAGDQFGAGVGTAGDINNDGFDDIIIGAPFANTNQGRAYVIHSGREIFRIINNKNYLGCLPTFCTSCVSRTCQVCDLGYGLSTNSLCEACPNNCYRCSVSSICEECNSPYLLYQSWCLPACPTRTYASNSQCQGIENFLISS